MRLAVIGGAGRMGHWFTKYFTRKGFSTVICDTRVEKARALAASVGATFCSSCVDAVESVDVVLICIPIEATTEVVINIAPHMKKGAILAEISSIKYSIKQALRKASQNGVRPLSLHPLFGPSADSLNSERIVVIPIKDEEQEVEMAGCLFPEADILIAEEDVHDRAMALILSLTYFVNMAFTGVLSGEDLELLKKLAGSTFTIQLAVAQGVLSEAPELIASAIKGNPFAKSYIDKFLSKVKWIREVMDSDDKSLLSLCESLVTNMESDPDFAKANERRQSAFKVLRSHATPEDKSLVS